MSGFLSEEKDFEVEQKRASSRTLYVLEFSLEFGC